MVTSLRIGGLPLSLDIGSQTLFVNCSTIQEFHEARSLLPQALSIARGVGALYVGRRCGGKVEIDSVASIEVGMSNFLQHQGANPPKLYSPLELHNLITNANLSKEALSVVMMEGDRQLFTTYGHQQHCGVGTELWRGLCARDYFSDDQYRYYREQLERYQGEVCEITYRSFRIDPMSLKTGEERRLTVQAQTAQSTYGWIRIVKTLADESVPAI